MPAPTVPAAAPETTAMKPAAAEATASRSVGQWKKTHGGNSTCNDYCFP
jgi:hypothetical protein